MMGRGKGLGVVVGGIAGLAAGGTASKGFMSMSVASGSHSYLNSADGSDVQGARSEGSNTTRFAGGMMGVAAAGIPALAIVAGGGINEKIAKKTKNPFIRGGLALARNPLGVAAMSLGAGALMAGYTYSSNKSNTIKGMGY